jgi:hypothetical protein
VCVRDSGRLYHHGSPKPHHHRLNRQKQRPALRRILDELSAGHVEALGLVVLGVDEHGGDADALGSGGDAAESVRQHVSTKAPACVVAAYGEAADDGDRNNVRRIAADFAGRSATLDRPGRNAEISRHAIALADDIGTGELAFVVERAVLEPLVQRGFAAVKIRCIKLRRERDWLREFCRLAHGCDVSSSTPERGEAGRATWGRGRADCRAP